MQIDDYILGDRQLHEDLYAAAEILLEFISTAPRSMTIERLARYTGRTRHDIAVICRALERVQLLHRDPISPGTWSLTRAPEAVTLEDAFLATLASEHRGRLTRQSQSTSTAMPGEIGLLLMQATIGISVNLFTYLRQIPLGRARCAGGGIAMHP